MEGRRGGEGKREERGAVGGVAGVACVRDGDTRVPLACPHMCEGARGEEAVAACGPAPQRDNGLPEEDAGDYGAEHAGADGYNERGAFLMRGYDTTRKVGSGQREYSAM